MKKIMTIALLFAAITSAYAHPDSATCTDQPSDTPEKANTAKDAPAPIATPAADHSAAGTTDKSVIYVGTNDFSLALVREGIRKA